MANLTWAQIRALARLKALDTDSAAYVVQDADILLLANEVIFQWKKRTDAALRQYTDADLGISYLQGDRYQLFTAADIEEIVAFYLVSDPTGSGTFDDELVQLEKMELHEIIDLQSSDTTQAPPTKYAIHRYASPDGGQITRHLVYLHPLPDQEYKYTAICRTVTYPLSADSDKPDVTLAECYGLAGALAAKVARLCGRSEEFINELWAQVPDDMRAALMRTEWLKSPRTGAP